MCLERILQPQRGCSTVALLKTWFNPFRVEGNSWCVTHRVARASQSWAGGCIPFGIEQAGAEFCFLCSLVGMIGWREGVLGEPSDLLLIQKQDTGAPSDGLGRASERLFTPSDQVLEPSDGLGEASDGVSEVCGPGSVLFLERGSQNGTVWGALRSFRGATLALEAIS